MIPKALIDKLKLISHPEGGMYSETYRSSRTIKFPEEIYAGGERQTSTNIYFALDGDDFSAFHRLTNSDETWFYHQGSSIKIYIIKTSGDLEEIILGDPLKDPNANLQVTVPGNNWFAAEPLDKSSYSLVSCVVAPGFDFRDFTLADRSILSKDYPAHLKLIEKLTRVDLKNASLLGCNEESKEVSASFRL